MTQCDGPSDSTVLKLSAVVAFAAVVYTFAATFADFEASDVISATGAWGAVLMIAASLLIAVGFALVGLAAFVGTGVLVSLAYDSAYAIHGLISPKARAEKRTTREEAEALQRRTFEAQAANESDCVAASSGSARSGRGLCLHTFSHVEIRGRRGCCGGGQGLEGPFGQTQRWRATGRVDNNTEEFVDVRLAVTFHGVNTA